MYNVLFLCTGNSARSILAEAILGRSGTGKFHAFSAGSHPRGAVNPHALALLQRLGYDTAALRSKSWDEFARGPQFDFIFTVCDDAAAQTCPVWPGHPMTAHWGMPDPAAMDSDASDDITITRVFRDAYAALERRITVFAALPIKSLDRLALKKRLDDIGARQDAG